MTRQGVGNRELARLFRMVSKFMVRAHHGGGHAPHAQFKLVALIHEKGPISQGDLLTMLDIRSSSLSELLAKLERSGLVVRERNPEDRRSFIVSTTPEAEALLAGSVRDEREIAGSLFACLDEAEKETLHALLTKMAGSLGEQHGPLRGGRGGRGGRGRGPGGRGRGRGRGMGGPPGGGRRGRR